MKRRAWKWVLGGVAAAALAVGGIARSAHRRADAVFEREELRVREAIAALRERRYRRALLYPPATPGDGYAIFEKALGRFGLIPLAEVDEIPAVNGQPDFVPDPEALEDFFEKHEPLIEGLRDSNRCADFRPAYLYEAGFSMNLSSVTTAIRTVRILEGRAQHFADSGRRGGALESILLGLALAQDAGRGGVLINRYIQIVCEGVTAETLRTLLPLEEFGAAELASFAAKLDLLAEARPDIVEACAAEEACLLQSLAEIGNASATMSIGAVGRDGVVWGRSWRFLYSRRLACAGAMVECEQLFGRCQSLRDLAPHLRPAAMDVIIREAEASRNPIVRQLFPSVAKACGRDSVSLLSLTLMRVATAIAWYQAEKGSPPPTLADLVPRHLPRVPVCPLTGLPLGYRDGKVWSVGWNRVDDGGKPGRDNDIDAKDGDYVWTVKRK